MGRSVCWRGHVCQGVSPLPASTECCTMDLTCIRAGGDDSNQIGHIPWMPSIAVCEDACRTTDGCTWFTWRRLEAFKMCYLFTECDMDISDESTISADISECSPDKP